METSTTDQHRVKLRWVDWNYKLGGCLKTVVEAEAEALGHVQRRQTHYPEGVEAVGTTTKILLEVGDGASTREDDGEAHEHLQQRRTRSIPEGGKNIGTTVEVGESISNQPKEQISKGRSRSVGGTCRSTSTPVKSGVVAQEHQRAGEGAGEGGAAGVGEMMWGGFILLLTLVRHPPARTTTRAATATATAAPREQQHDSRLTPMWGNTKKN
jgi:hypothetical protein